jgi:hypothetical protein
MTLSGKSHGRKLSFSFAGHDISAWVEEVGGLPGEVELGDITTAGSVGHVSWPGLEKASITLKCLFDDAATSAFSYIAAILNGYATASPPAVSAFIYGPAGTTAGFAKISGNCWVNKIDFPAKVTDPLKFTVTMTVDNGFTIGTF